jgi:hypothetical protein
MKRNAIFVAAALAAVAGALAYRFAGADNDAHPVANPIAASTASPGAPSPFASGPAAPEPVAAPAPTGPQSAPPSPPPAPPVPVPAPIAKALAAVRAEAPSRPMTQLAKDWFGCASEDGYNSMLSQIRQKSANLGDHFHGPDADCAPLPTGTHISVMHIDNGSGIAQISIDETHKVYWTDSEVLAGERK